MGLLNLSILVNRIKNHLQKDGYVKNTDYASSYTAGVVKVDSTYATEITSGGKLKAKEISSEAYSEANDSAFISKATLDNVLSGFSGGFTADVLFDGGDNKPDAVQNATVTLAHDYSDYKMFAVILQRSDLSDTTAFFYGQGAKQLSVYVNSNGNVQPLGVSFATNVMTFTDVVAGTGMKTDKVIGFK